MLESLYYVAKCKVKIDDFQGAINDLTTCVLKDKEYFIKAFTDSDFNGVDGFMDRLADNIKSKIYPELKKKYDEIIEIDTYLSKIYSMNNNLPDEFPKNFTIDDLVFDILIYLETKLFEKVLSKIKKKKKKLIKMKQKNEKQKREKEKK